MPKTQKTETSVAPVVPFSIILRKEAARHGIDGIMLERLHSIDLQCLIIQFKIDELNDYFRIKNKNVNKGTDTEVYKERISGRSAFRMLGGR